MTEYSFPSGNCTAAGGGAATIAVVNQKNEEGGCGGGGSVSGGFGEKERLNPEWGHRNSAGNRWPREYTLALLKIRSDMDVAFRRSILKAPLWDEVSRKLGELGYHRSAKKCKEKFNNIYKYHNRTKEGRSGRQNGKNYPFFEQLEAFDNQFSLPSPPPNKIQTLTTGKTMFLPMTTTNPKIIIKPTSISPCDFTSPCLSLTEYPCFEFSMSTSTSTTSSSGKESENNVKRKRKLEDYFEKLMGEVLEKQENLQNKFIEAIEKCENERLVREEAWKMQELARVKKEQETIAHERAIAAAKDATVIAFLQKMSEQLTQMPLPENPTPLKNKKEESNHKSSVPLSHSRWPNAAIEGLIRLRTDFDLHYQDSGAKGSLWEEISLGMKKLGYDRSAKRCKEKWENINKYYKRIRESKKKRAEDSKTCHYYKLLHSVYESRKTKKVDGSESSGFNLKPEDILMEMMGQQQQQQLESENVNQSQEDDGDDDDNEDDFQIVANLPSSIRAE